MSIGALPKGLKENLEEDEVVLHVVKKKLYIEKPKWLVVTNRRIIYFDEKILGRYEMTSIPYEKLEKIYSRIGLIAAKFVLSIEDGGRVELTWMDKEEARRATMAIYNAMKSIAVEPPTLTKKKHILSEEMVLVKPKEFIVRSASAQLGRDVRSRVVEEVRESGRRDPVELLRMLKELKEAGVITEEEYNEKKRKILETL